MIIKVEDIILEPNYIILEEFIPEQEGYVQIVSAEDKPIFGKIVNIKDSILYKIGDILMFTMHSTVKIPMNGTVYYLLNKDDVVGYVKEKTTP